MGTLYYIAISFITLYVVGVYYFYFVRKNRKASVVVKFMHGLFLLSTMGLLFVSCYSERPQPAIDNVLLSIIIVQALIIISRKYIGRKTPLWLGIAHAITAGLGFAILIDFAFFEG